MYNRIRQIRNQVVHARGVVVDEAQILSAAAEIDELIDWIENESFVTRLQAMGAQERQELIEEMLNDASFGILDSDEVSSAMAETNALGYEMEPIEIDGVIFDEGDCVVKFSFTAVGEHDAENDKMFFGDTINGTGEARIDSSGALSFEEIHAEVDHGEPDEDEFDPGDVPFEDDGDDNV